MPQQLESDFDDDTVAVCSDDKCFHSVIQCAHVFSHLNTDIFSLVSFNTTEAARL